MNFATHFVYKKLKTTFTSKYSKKQIQRVQTFDWHCFQTCGQIYMHIWKYRIQIFHISAIISCLALLKTR